MKRWILLFTFFCLGCTSGNCRSQRESKMDDKKQDEVISQISANSQARIKVYKYDGSLQCGMGKAIPLAEMQKSLAGITVHSAENKPDGLMHTQVCGSPTGRANVFEIDKTSLEAAKKKGFKEWTFE